MLFYFFAILIITEPLLVYLIAFKINIFIIVMYLFLSVHNSKFY